MWAAFNARPYGCLTAFRRYISHFRHDALHSLAKVALAFDAKQNETT
jgi:hypothetical protein